MRTAAFILALALLAHPTLSQTTTTFPLGDNFRPGKYLPAAVSANSRGGQSTFETLELPGAIPVRIHLSAGHADAIFPILIIDPAASNLRPLRDDQLLIACATPAPPQNLDPALPPGKYSLILIQLDPRQLTAGPACAFESLDALILDPATLASLGDLRLGQFLSSGTRIIVDSPTRPDARWPWQPAGVLWVLSPDIRGPADIQSALIPIAGEEPAWPPALRRRLFLCAALFSLAAIAASFLRRRPALAVAAVSAASAIALAAWWHSRPTLLIKQGTIVVQSNNLTQADQWIYPMSPALAPFSIPVQGWSKVFSPSPAAARAIALRLDCAPDGSIQSIAGLLPPALRLAILSREIALNPPLPPTSMPAPPTSPMSRLAQRAYTRPTDTTHLLPAPATPDPLSLIESYPPVLVRAFPAP